MAQPIRDHGGHLGFSIGLKNTNLVEDTKVLLPLNFNLILLNHCREKVKNILANQREARVAIFVFR